MVKHPAGDHTFHETWEQASAVAGEKGGVRTACARLLVTAGGLQCAIHATKPESCLRFPYPLENHADREHCQDEEEPPPRDGCALAAALGADPALRLSYREWLAHRLEATREPPAKKKAPARKRAKSYRFGGDNHSYLLQ